MKAVSKALKTVQDDCDYGRRQLQRGCPSQQRAQTLTYIHTHTQTCSYIHTCKTYKLHLFGLCPFGTFWRINGSPGPLWWVHFQVRVQLKVQLRFQVQCHPMRNAIKTNYQIYVWKRQKTTRQIRNNKTKQKAFIKQLPTLLVFQTICKLSLRVYVCTRARARDDSSTGKYGDLLPTNIERNRIYRSRRYIERSRKYLTVVEMNNGNINVPY